MMVMTDADFHDLLLRVESAMHREGIPGWQVERVINTLIYGEPDAPDVIYNAEEGRVLRRKRALAQARAHERAMDRLQSELRTAGEAYAYASALAVRDAAMDLVGQLREDLGEHDPDLIVGEVVRGEDATWADYEQSRRSTAASLRRMIGSLDPASRMEAALVGVAGCFAQQLEAPSPLGHRQAERAVLSPHCYDASWGRVHVRPGCRCPR
jgi:hypothetical protein